MIARLAVLLLFACVHQSESALKRPSYFKPCARTDPNLNQCIKKNGQEAISTLVKGDRKYKIPELNPFFLPELNIAQGDNLKIVLRNSTIKGLENTIVENANFDFKNKKISMDFTLPFLNLNSNYEISGRILVLPLSGKGPSSMEMDKVSFTYSFDYDLVKKGNDNYMKPKKANIKYKTEKFKLHFENLFNGDRVLGTETNNFLNENWKEVNKELGPGVAEALAQVINLVISNVSALVPFDELFPEKL